jgi:uncharacterized protein
MGRHSLALLTRLLAFSAAALLAAAAAADPPAWRVSDGDGNELWLLGSVHYLREQDYPLPPVIDSLYEQADVIVMELDLDDLDPLRAQAAFMQAALLPEGITLEERLDPEVYARADEHARRLGFELRLLAQLEPWLVAVTLLDRGLAERGVLAESGIERYLLARAARDRKPVLGLETVEQQVRVFAGLSADEQQALLEQTLDELDASGTAIDELIDAWREGRLETLANGLSAEFERFPTLYDALIVERNRAWIEPLEGHLRASDARLVVVGALHLVGEHSVLDLLRERGYEVGE